MIQEIRGVLTNLGSVPIIFIILFVPSIGVEAKIVKRLAKADVVKCVRRPKLQVVSIVCIGGGRTLDQRLFRGGSLGLALLAALSDASVDWRLGGIAM